MVSFRLPDGALVAAGGAAGTGARIALDAVAAAFPARGLFLSWSTLVVNVVGAFVLGALVAWAARGSRRAEFVRRVRLLAGTGFAGAFTTYGTYIVASVGAVSAGGIVEAVASSVALLLLGAVCAWGGVRAGVVLCAHLSGGVFDSGGVSL